MRRTALLLAALLASGLGACSKCDVPTYQSLAQQPQACAEKPALR